MVCEACGTHNREGAQFCRQCGAPLEKRQPPPTQPSLQSPLPYEFVEEPAPTPRSGGNFGIFGGYVLAIVAALVAAVAFFLPWFVFSGRLYSGVDAVVDAAQGVNDATFFIWGLVPLGALALGGWGLIGVLVWLFRRASSPSWGRVLVFPLLLVFSGLCSCGPLAVALATPLFSTAAGTLNDVLASVDYGFWVALGALGGSALGVVMALIGGIAARRRSS